MSGSILAGLALDTTTQSIADRLDAPLMVDGSAATQPISAEALPLPDGAAADATLVGLSDQLDAATGVSVEDASASEEAVALLGAILSRLGYPDQAQGALRVSIVAGNVGVNGTPNVNMQTAGGVYAVYDQYAALLACGQAVRNRITVT